MGLAECSQVVNIHLGIPCITGSENHPFLSAEDSIWGFMCVERCSQHGATPLAPQLFSLNTDVTLVIFDFTLFSSTHHSSPGIARTVLLQHSFPLHACYSLLICSSQRKLTTNDCPEMSLALSLSCLENPLSFVKLSPAHTDIKSSPVFPVISHAWSSIYPFYIHLYYLHTET